MGLQFAIRKNCELHTKISVTKTTLSSYESDIRKLSYENLIESVLYFGVSMDWLFGNAKSNDTFALNLFGFTDEQKNLVTDSTRVIRQNNTMRNAEKSYLRQRNLI